MQKILLAMFLVPAIGLLCKPQLEAADWPQFRGPNGLGAAADAKVPTAWSDSKNLKWKAALPGPGSSSPIIVGDRIFLTCYTGYGIDAANPGDPKDLKRLLVCLNKADGNVAWTLSEPGSSSEDRYAGFITEHGYASSTPVSDGKNVFAFLSKSGLLAADVAGKKLWKTSLGTGSDPRRWGSGGSPIIYKNLVIATASSESKSIRGLDMADGKVVWTLETSKLDLTFGTPTIATDDAGKEELIVTMPGEIWGVDPLKGTKVWSASVPMLGNVSPSAIVHDGIVYATGGFQGRGTVAIKIGGSGDVTKSNTLWSVRDSSYVPSPLYCDGRLHWVSDDGYAVALDAKSGKQLYRERLPLKGGGPRGSRPVYASAVLAGDTIYAPSRTNGVFVYKAGPTFELIATNQLDDKTDFNASPAVADNKLYLRSNKFLYCIGE